MGFVSLTAGVSPQPAPADPTGGLNADAEARASIGQIIDALILAGVFTP